MNPDAATAPPEPLTTSDCDLSGVEPPWDLFVRMAVDQYCVPKDKAQAAIDDMRRQYWAERGIV